MLTSTSGDGVCHGIAQRLTQAVGPNRYQMWFGRSARMEYRAPQRRLQVAVPNRFVADWIDRHYRQALAAAARDELGHEVDVQLAIDAAAFPQPAVTAPAVMPLPAPAPVPHAVRREGDSPLPRYRLDDFVVGPCNELAFAAAQRLAESDPTAPGADAPAVAPLGPLFIHGGVGLGKTHLLQGVCRRMRERHPHARVLYTTGEQFTNEFLTAIRTHKIDAFRQRMRRLDVLAVDDVHFIADKQATQQEFLHCFNAMELAGARVVLASDQHPGLIAKFSAALVSRCVHGVVAQVQPPDTATRVRIVQALAQRRGLSLLESVAAVVAQQCPGSVRELEGTLTRLQAMATLLPDPPAGRTAVTLPAHHAPVPAPPTGAAEGNVVTHGVPHAGAGARAIGHALVNRVFAARHEADRARPVRVQSILHAVAQRLGLDPQRILRGDRHRLVVLGRALVVHLARQLTPLSYPEIAQALGKAGHSSVLTAQQRLLRQIEAHEHVMFVHAQSGTPENVSLEELVEQVRHDLRREQTGA